MKYNYKKIEKRWQKAWEKTGLYQAKDFSKKPKFYILVEFPYPSGKGLHVGHCRSFTALDVVARKKRMDGFNVLFPMGWDAFGLPTENYAVKTNIHPKIITKKNTSFFKRQENNLGFSFDWNREINTTDPAYYKWTQWIFLKLFENGLAYKTKMPINWCPSCKIGLANEEVVDGKCERCGAAVIRREKEQWMLKITKYAERLINDLNKVDYPEKVKILQKDWIGKSEGDEVIFKINFSGNTVGQRTESLFRNLSSIVVFTTRLDTIFGATYLVIAPEHPFITALLSAENKLLGISNKKEVARYIEKAKKKLEKERISAKKVKTGIIIEGIQAINPATGKNIPVFVADYVLPSYGTGAIMGVPYHDARDFDFAKKYNLPMVKVINSTEEIKEKIGFALSDEGYRQPYIGEGILVNSQRFNGLDSKTARKKIREIIGRRGLVKKAVHYKLRDWVFSRQRYWGEPIPLVYCEHCSSEIKSRKFRIQNKKFNKGELLNPGWIALPENSLPLELPPAKNYKPTAVGESPLAKITKWTETRCPKCGNLAKRETDVMPNWAGSNWYYLRYCDPKNDEKLASKKLLQYWMPVDWYNGGMEHTTLHLLYSRFIYKFLWDVKVVPTAIGPEPYRKRTSHGMILGKGGIKMSKSKGNVIDPNEVVSKFGADALRVYEMFIGPFSQAISWDTKGIKGAERFLEKVWALFEKFQKRSSESVAESKFKNVKSIENLISETIKKVGNDIEQMKFNTAIASLMALVNELQKQETVKKKDFENLLLILAPFAPHISEEIWQKIHGKRLKDYNKRSSIFSRKWPKFQKNFPSRQKNITLIIQINGKVRDKAQIKRKITKEEIKNIILRRDKVKKWLSGKKVKKIIFIPDKLINFVI